jgi:hypothetical protein
MTLQVKGQVLLNLHSCQFTFHHEAFSIEQALLFVLSMVGDN